jgi:Tfp pilus assembly protein PilX
MPGTHMLRTGAQSGAALLAFLATLMLVMAAISAAAMHLLLAGRTMTSQWLDREIAFRAAEVALLDAEADLIAATTDHGSARLASWPQPGACGTGPQQGLCRADGDVSAWLPWLSGDAPNGTGIALGAFTGATMPALPDGVIGATTPPRYLIEVLENGTGMLAGMWPRFRITALGLGRDTSVRVLLQTEFQP